MFRRKLLEPEVTIFCKTKKQKSFKKKRKE